MMKCLLPLFVMTFAKLSIIVNTHMRLYSSLRNGAEAKMQEISRKSILAIAVWAADKLDASRHPAGRRHRDL